MKVLHRGKFVELVQEGRWEYVRRVKAKGAVFVLATTPARELVLVEQDRVPVHARTIELPAGIYGDDESGADETPEHCALRELEEETGFRGGAARIVMDGPVAPGLTSELMYLVHVQDLVRVHAGGGIAGENITVHTVALDRLDAWLADQRAAGKLVESRIYAGLHFLSKEG